MFAPPSWLSGGDCCPTVHQIQLTLHVAALTQQAAPWLHFVPQLPNPTLSKCDASSMPLPLAMQCNAVHHSPCCRHRAAADEEGVALGWRLQKGWAQRLQRGPSVMGPAKMVVVPAAPALRAMHQTPAGHVALGYSIKFEGPGKLRLAHHDVLVYVDLDHA
jgi:hypothetical protein